MTANTKSKAKILPGANSIIVVGYALVAVGLMGVITINGASGDPFIGSGRSGLLDRLRGLTVNYRNTEC